MSQEQATAERRKELREQAEQRKIQAAKKKAEEDRIKAEEDKKARAIELEEKRKIRLENERKRKEREERIAAAAKEKEDKEVASRKVSTVIDGLYLVLTSHRPRRTLARNASSLLLRSTNPVLSRRWHCPARPVHRSWSTSQRMRRVRCEQSSRLSTWSRLRPPLQPQSVLPVHPNSDQRSSELLRLLSHPPSQLSQPLWSFSHKRRDPWDHHPDRPSSQRTASHRSMSRLRSKTSRLWDKAARLQAFFSRVESH